MKKFMALYMAPAAMIQQMMQMTPEQAKAGMAEWTKWSDAHDHMIDDLGAPLGKTKRVTTGGVSDTRNELTGYSIVEADSFEDAVAMFKDHPHLKMGAGASVDVLECMSMEDMM